MQEERELQSLGFEVLQGRDALGEGARDLAEGWETEDAGEAPATTEMQSVERAYDPGKEQLPLRGPCGKPGTLCEERPCVLEDGHPDIADRLAQKCVFMGVGVA